MSLLSSIPEERGGAQEETTAQTREREGAEEEAVFQLPHDEGAESRRLRQEVTDLRAELENCRLRAELDTLRAVERLRQEHEDALKRERSLHDAERSRMESLWDYERQLLQDKVQQLEGKLAAAETHGDGESEGEEGGQGAEEAGLHSSARVDSPGADSESVSEEGSVRDSGDRGSDGRLTPSCETEPSAVLRAMTELLQKHTEAVAAQTRAVSIQSLPRLPVFTGEGEQVKDDGFERWLEKLKERSRICRWTADEQLYQLKSHLDKTATEVFRMIPEDERSSFDKAVEALKSRFKPVEIEELRGLEFHHKKQVEGESVEQLGIVIQQLGRRAFPLMKGKELDRLLKGRFYQALFVKWQRKLGAPKPEESFYALYDRARMLETHEKQYSSGSRLDGPAGNRTTRGPGRNQASTGGVPKQRGSGAQVSGDPAAGDVSSDTTEPNQRSAWRCFRCQSTKHLARNCPQKREARGHGQRQPSTGNQSAAAAQVVNPAELSDEQLDQLLAEHRLRQERQALEQSTGHNFVVNTVQANTVPADGTRPTAVGPTVTVEINIEGVAVEALVDSGAQSTIISRSVLHQIGIQRRRNGLPLPLSSNHPQCASMARMGSWEVMR